MTLPIVEFHDLTHLPMSDRCQYGNSEKWAIPVEFISQAKRLGIELAIPRLSHAGKEVFAGIFYSMDKIPAAKVGALHNIIVLHQGTLDTCPDWANHLIEGRGSKGIKWALRYIQALGRVDWAHYRYGAHADAYFWFAKGHSTNRRSLVVLLHGGFWGRGVALDHMAPLGAHLAMHGFSVVNLEIRRGGDWAEGLNDVIAALARLHQSAGELSFDFDGLICVGHSSGAHLIYIALQRLRGIVKSKLLVSLGGILDLEAARQQASCRAAIDRVELLSRSSLLDPGCYSPVSPMLIVEGALDVTVPPLGRRSKLRQFSNHVKFIKAEDRDHMDLLKTEGLLWDNIVRVMREAV